VAHLAKIAVGVDKPGGAIVAADTTTNDLSDGQCLPDLLDQIMRTSRRSQAVGPMTRVITAEA
jgi:hypothetical protein